MATLAIPPSAGAKKSRRRNSLESNSSRDSNKSKSKNKHKNKSKSKNKNKSSSNRTKMSASFGSLLRRMGGSQRSLHTEVICQEEPLQKQQQQQQQHQQQQEDTTKDSSLTSQRVLGGLLRKAQSLRGLESSKSRRRLDLEQENVGDGPSGVASFITQIEPQKPEQVSEQTPEPSKSKGVLRGMIRKAASLRGLASSSNKTKEKEAEDLEPVFVLTDENHGKVVFQNLDESVGDLAPYNVNQCMHNSLPDLVLSNSGLSGSSTTSSSSSSSGGDSPAGNRLHNSFSTCQTATSHSMCGSMSEEFFLDFSVTELNGPEEEEGDEESAPAKSTSVVSKKDSGSSSRSGSKGLRSRLRTFFRKTKSGRSIVETKTESALEAPSSNKVPAQAKEDLKSPAKKRVDKILSSLQSEAVQTKPPATPHPKQQQRYRAQASIQEIPLPCLMDDSSGDLDHEDESGRRRGRRTIENMANAMGFMDCLPEEPMQEDESEEDIASNASEDEDSDIEDDDTYENDFPAPVVHYDIVVPPREYDELEKFYEEETFAHVGGSMLLGQASELMTVLEYDEQEYESSDDGNEEDSDDDGTGPDLHDLFIASSLPVLEEEMDVSFRSAATDKW